jgi:hypothetical protein
MSTITKITIDRATLEQALEALDSMRIVDLSVENLVGWNKTVTALRGALAGQTVQQEPVAWDVGSDLVMRADMRERLAYRGPWVDVGRAIPDSWVPALYTAAPAAPVPL